MSQSLSLLMSKADAKCMEIGYYMEQLESKSTGSKIGEGATLGLQETTGAWLVELEQSVRTLKKLAAAESASRRGLWQRFVGRG